MRIVFPQPFHVKHCSEQIQVQKYETHEYRDSRDKNILWEWRISEIKTFCGSGGLQWHVCRAKKRKKKKKKKKADLTTVLHIRQLPHLHMKLAVWFSFPTTNNKNPMIPS